MTCTLYFYKLPVNLMGKNFILESLETYLATLTPLSISSFQFQRFDIEKKIKVNMNQDYAAQYTAITKYNYLKITQARSAAGQTGSVTYYYIIKSAKQISQSTIEFELHMDVLNTFQFSASAANNTYTLSDKSLITREHKNRLGSKQVIGSSNYVFNDWDDLIDDVSFGFLTDMFSNGTHSLFDVTDEWNINTLTKGGTHANGYNCVGKIAIIKTATTCRIGFRDEDNNLREINLTTLAEIKNTYIVIRFTNTLSSLAKSFFKQGDIQNKFIFDPHVICKRLVDKFQEGIEAITFKINEHTLYDKDVENQWYVVYSSTNGVVQNPDDTAATFVNPVQCRFYSDYGYKLTTSSSIDVRFTASDMPNINNYREYLFISKSDLGASGYVVINGTTYTAADFPSGWEVTLVCERINNSDITFSRVGFIYREDYVWPKYGLRQWFEPVIATNIEYIDIHGVNYLGVWRGLSIETTETFRYQTIYIGSGESTTSVTSNPFSELDLTDSKLIKAINFPYCPVEELVGNPEMDKMPENFVVVDNTLGLNKIQKTQFKRQLHFTYSPFEALFVNVNSSEFGYNKSRDIKYESKLYHSDFYLPKFVYDSFAFQFRLEDVNVTSLLSFYEEENFNVTYVCSNNMKSKFMFQFDDYVCDRELQDYNNVLVIERNNEKALYTNAYINYIRSGGYIYDTKNADMQKLTSGLTIALSVVGSVGSIVGGIATENPIGIAAGVGMAVATATRTISAIHSAQQNDRQIAQKLMAAANQATSVSTSEDLDILKAYSGNKAKLCIYQVSSYLREALWDLFHYFGYKCQEYKIPVVNTRIYFNFVQGQILLKDYTFNDDIASEIISKWQEGVTFMHIVSANYDWNQQYENFETNLL